MDRGAALGLDIGGGSTKLGLISADGRLLRATRVVLAEGADFPAIMDQYRTAIASLDADEGLPVGIALCREIRLVVARRRAAGQHQQRHTHQGERLHCGFLFRLRH